MTPVSKNNSAQGFFQFFQNIGKSEVKNRIQTAANGSLPLLNENGLKKNRAFVVLAAIAFVGITSYVVYRFISHKASSDKTGRPAGDTSETAAGKGRKTGEPASATTETTVGDTTGKPAGKNDKDGPRIIEKKMEMVLDFDIKELNKMDLVGALKKAKEIPQEHSLRDKAFGIVVDKFKRILKNFEWDIALEIARAVPLDYKDRFFEMIAANLASKLDAADIKTFIKIAAQIPDDAKKASGIVCERFKEILKKVKDLDAIKDAADQIQNESLRTVWLTEKATRATLTDALDMLLAMKSGNTSAICEVIAGKVKDLKKEGLDVLPEVIRKISETKQSITGLDLIFVQVAGKATLIVALDMLLSMKSDNTKAICEVIAGKVKDLKKEGLDVLPEVINKILQAKPNMAGLDLIFEQVADKATLTVALDMLLEMKVGNTSAICKLIAAKVKDLTKMYELLELVVKISQAKSSIADFDLIFAQVVERLKSFTTIDDVDKLQKIMKGIPKKFLTEVLFSKIVKSINVEHLSQILDMVLLSLSGNDDKEARERNAILSMIAVRFNEVAKLEDAFLMALRIPPKNKNLSALPAKEIAFTNVLQKASLEELQSLVEKIPKEDQDSYALFYSLVREKLLGSSKEKDKVKAILGVLPATIYEADTALFV